MDDESGQGEAVEVLLHFVHILNDQSQESEGLMMVSIECFFLASKVSGRSFISSSVNCLVYKSESSGPRRKIVLDPVT